MMQKRLFFPVLSTKLGYVMETALLEDIPNEKKDWHPDSEHVLDLVHPSLYCCVFGETRCVKEPLLRDDGESCLEQMHRSLFCADVPVENVRARSTKYQWIPSDFVVDAGGCVRIASYINNLHPAVHTELYKSIGHIFEKFVPMFDRVLTCLTNPDGPPEVLGAYYKSSKRDMDDTIPKPPPLPKHFPLDSRTTYTMKGTTVQVIVKIAEIVLTPENPGCGGGAWHIEGTNAEQIVATGIYYFGCDNITDSRLSFRVIVNEPPYVHNDDVGIHAVYGLANGKRLLQPLGSALVVEDRCLVFPNTLQHRVERVGLADRTRPGVRKILAFFVVDPAKRIPSTLTIPPQQRSWRHAGAWELVSQIPHELQLPSLLDHLHLTPGMSLKEAQRHRRGLMRERSYDEDDEDDPALAFSFCEH